MKSISVLSAAVIALLLTSSTLAFSNGGLPDDAPADCPNSNVNPCPECPDGSGGGGPSGGGGSQPETKPLTNSTSCLMGPCNSALREGSFGGPTKAIYKSPQNTPGYAFASTPDEGQMGKRMIRIIRQDAHLVGNGGMALQLNRIHNNINVNHFQNTEGYTGFGPRWYSNHDIRIGSYGAATSNIYLRRADGGMTVLYNVAANKWETNPSQGETLYVDKLTTGFQMRTADPGLWYEFNNWNQLTKIRFPNGNMLNYVYDAGIPSRLSTVSMDHETSDTDDRYLQFSYTSITYGSRTRDRISATTIMPANTVAASYEYDSHGMLYRVKNKHGEVIEEYINSNVSGLPLIAENRAQNRTGGVSLQRKYTYQNQFEVFQLADGAQRVFVQNNYGAGTQFYALTTFQLTADGQGAKADGHSLNFARTPAYSAVQAPNNGPVVSQTSQHFRADTTWQALSDLPKELVDNNGTTTSFEYVNDNPTGNDFKRRLLKKKTAPDGRIAQYEYDAHGRVTRAHDNRGNDSSKTYDTKGNVSSAADAISGLVSYYFYDVRGNKIRQEGPTSTTVLTWTYDGRGNLIKSTDAEQFETVNQYNAKDQLTTVTSRGQTVGYHFDSRDRATTTVDTLGNKAGSDYDNKGFLLRSRDALGNTTSYDYNTTGLLSKLTHPDGSYQAFQYDFYDKLTTQTDERGYDTVYEYDWKNRKTAQINPLGQRTQYVYGDSGSCSGCAGGHGDQVVQIIDSEGRSTYYEYDEVTGNLETKSFSGTAEEVNYTYDNWGRLIEVEDTRLSSTEFGSQSFHYDYDAQDRLTSETYPDGATVSWTYDSLGRRQTMTDPENNVTTYTYNNMSSNKKVASISHSFFGTEDYTYHTNGLLYYMYSPENNGVRTEEEFNYDSAGRLYLTASYDGEGHRLHREINTYDATNRKTLVKYSHNAELWEKHYSYDNTGPLTREANYESWGGGPLRHSSSYQIDYAKNRLCADHFNGLTTETIQYAYNQWNQLTSSTTSAGTTICQYDVLGNRTTETLGANVRVTEYDRWGRLSKFSNGPGTSETTYIYSFAGKLLERKDADGTREHYYYDGLNQVTIREKPANGFWRVSEVAMLREMSIAAEVMRRTYEYVGATTYTTDRGMHWNQNGHLTHETDENRLLAKYYESDAWGTVTSGQSTPATQEEFRYTGKRQDSIQGMYNYGERWINPGEASWQAAEPLGNDGPNLYHYVFHDPVNSIDVNGLAEGNSPHSGPVPHPHTPGDRSNDIEYLQRQFKNHLCSEDDHCAVRCATKCHVAGVTLSAGKCMSACVQGCIAKGRCADALIQYAICMEGSLGQPKRAAKCFTDLGGCKGMVNP